MTAASEDELAEFAQLVVELEERLEQSFAMHDKIVARQAANDQENARLRAELAAAGAIGEPLAAIKDSATLSVELIGKLNEALKPVTLDGKVRETIEELTRSLTGNLEQLGHHAERAGAIAGNLAPAPKGPSDAWAAELDALRQEFPVQASAGEGAPQPETSATDASEPAASGPGSSDSEPAHSDPPDSDLPESASPEPALSGKEQG